MNLKQRKRRSGKLRRHSSWYPIALTLTSSVSLIGTGPWGGDIPPHQSNVKGVIGMVKNLFNRKSSSRTTDPHKLIGRKQISWRRLWGSDTIQQYPNNFTVEKQSNQEIQPVRTITSGEHIPPTKSNGKELIGCNVSDIGNRRRSLVDPPRPIKTSPLPVRSRTMLELNTILPDLENSNVEKQSNQEIQSQAIYPKQQLIPTASPRMTNSYIQRTPPPKPPRAQFLKKPTSDVEQSQLHKIPSKQLQPPSDIHTNNTGIPKKMASLTPAVEGLDDIPSKPTSDVTRTNGESNKPNASLSDNGYDHWRAQYHKPLLVRVLPPKCLKAPAQTRLEQRRGIRPMNEAELLRAERQLEKRQRYPASNNIHRKWVRARILSEEEKNARMEQGKPLIEVVDDRTKGKWEWQLVDMTPQDIAESVFTNRPCRSTADASWFNDNWNEDGTDVVPW